MTDRCPWSDPNDVPTCRHQGKFLNIYQKRLSWRRRVGILDKMHPMAGPECLARPAKMLLDLSDFYHPIWRKLKRRISNSCETDASG